MFHQGSLLDLDMRISMSSSEFSSWRLAKSHDASAALATFPFLANGLGHTRIR